MRVHSQQNVFFDSIKNIKPSLIQAKSSEYMMNFTHKKNNIQANIRKRYLDRYKKS